MVRLHFYSVLATFKVVVPMLKAFNYYHEFFVRSRVVKLSALKLLGKESNRVPLLSVFVEL